MKKVGENTLKLYLVTDAALCGKRPFDWVVEEAVKGGVTMVQLREKELPEEEFIQKGKRMKALLQPYGVPLIINDNVEVALACGADGVHLGQSDMGVVRARKILGPDSIIGLSVENFDQVQQAQTLDVDYIAASPVYKTTTKKNTKTVFGTEGVRKIVRMSRHPVVGIGRMNEKTAADVILAGAAGVAVVSAIMTAYDPKMAAEKIAARVNEAISQRTLLKDVRVRWSSVAAISVHHIVRKIENEHFFSEMMAGNLKYHCFNDFVVQNALIFNEYVRLLKYLEVRIENESSRRGMNERLESILKRLLTESAVEEKAMFEFYIGEPSRLNGNILSSDGREYLDYLAEQVKGTPLHIAFSAMLSRYVIFRELGVYIKKHQNHESNRYIVWMNHHSCQEFFNDVEAFSGIVDEIAAAMSFHQRIQMLKAFRKTSFLQRRIWKNVNELERNR